MTNGNGDFHDHSDGYCVRLEEESFNLTIDIIPFSLAQAGSILGANPCYELKWRIDLLAAGAKWCRHIVPEDACEMNIHQGGAKDSFSIWVSVNAQKYTDTGGCTKTIETELGKSKVDTCEEENWKSTTHRANGSISVCPGSKLWPHDEKITRALGHLRKLGLGDLEALDAMRRLKDIVPSEMEGLLTKLLKEQFDKDGKLTDGWLMDLIKVHTMPRGMIADGLLDCIPPALESCCKLKNP